MAKLRTVPYGYEIRNGVVAVQPKESETVREIFSLYISGSTLQSISENLIQKSIPFYQGEVRWNKCSVKRIIDNGKYQSFPPLAKTHSLRTSSSPQNARILGCPLQGDYISDCMRRWFESKLA